MALSIPQETYEKVTLSADNDTAIFEGKIDSANPDVFLTPFFDKIMEQMGEQVKFDVTRLFFLNSSGIKCIVRFIVNKNPDAKVIFITDKEKTWQRTSLSIIQTLDKKNISIEDFEE